VRDFFFCIETTIKPGQVFLGQHVCHGAHRDAGGQLQRRTQNGRSRSAEPACTRAIISGGPPPCLSFRSYARAHGGGRILWELEALAFCPHHEHKVTSPCSRNTRGQGVHFLSLIRWEGDSIVYIRGLIAPQQPFGLAPEVSAKLKRRRTVLAPF